MISSINRLNIPQMTHSRHNQSSWKLLFLSVSDRFLPRFVVENQILSGLISVPSSHSSGSEAHVILKSITLPHHFKRHSHQLEIGRTILHIVFSSESTFTQIVQIHLSLQRMKIVVIRKIIWAAVFHFSPAAVSNQLRWSPSDLWWVSCGSGLVFFEEYFFFLFWELEK